MTDVIQVGLERLNRLSTQDAREALARCCGAQRWVEQMESARPFLNRDSIVARSDAIFGTFNRDDWMEAFAAHPRIGDPTGTPSKGHHVWSADEQSSTNEASEQALGELAALNRKYERRFGHTYIVYATGRATGEMIADLKSRLGNDPNQELTMASDQQRQITRNRIEKLLTALA